MGRGIGGLGSNVGPPRAFQNIIPANRDRARNALGGPGATTKLECAPPSYVGGLWLGGASRRTVAGGWGYTDATTIFGRCRGANQQIVGVARGRRRVNIGWKIVQLGRIASASISGVAR
jgi:hypothetical protein